MEINTSLKLTEDEKHELCEDIGQFISCIPGKKREITMINVTAGHYIELGQDPCLNIEFRLGGRSRFDAKRDFVRKVTDMLIEKYGFKPNRAFINIYECENWGAFGKYIDNTIIDQDLYD